MNRKAKAWRKVSQLLFADYVESMWQRWLESTNSGSEEHWQPNIVESIIEVMLNKDGEIDHEETAEIIAELNGCGKVYDLRKASFLGFLYWVVGSDIVEKCPNVDDRQLFKLALKRRKRHRKEVKKNTKNDLEALAPAASRTPDNPNEEPYDDGEELDQRPAAAETDRF